MEVLNCFNNHSLTSGSLFGTVKSVTVGGFPVKPCTEFPMYMSDPFNFAPFDFVSIASYNSF